MSALSIQPTYPIFTDIDGQPLEGGFVWIGQENLDPQVNPINVYWDSALTIPADQPIRTLGGYPSNSGTPARLYVNSDYSIRVMNKNGSVVYSAPAATERYSGEVITGVNAENVVYDPPFTNAAQTNVEAKLSQTVSVKDFGAVGNGVTDDTAAIQACFDAAYGKTVFIPKGNYLVTASLATPPISGEYGFTVIGDSEGQSVLSFDLSGSSDVDGIYLSNRPADPVNYGTASAYGGSSNGTYQRNLMFENLWIKNINGVSATPGTRTGSGLWLYFTENVSVRNVTCQGWKRGLDMWCWASNFTTVKARECDVGFYYWTGTTVVFSNTYADSCQYGYLVGGDPGTGSGNNTNTPGIQNPYPPHRPVSIKFTATAADASSLYSYCVNDCSNVTFDCVSSEGTTKGMFKIYKNLGMVSITNPNHSTGYGAFTSAECFADLGNGYTNVSFTDLYVNGSYSVAVFKNSSTTPYYEGSRCTVTNLRDLTTGVGAKVYQPQIYINNPPLESSGKTGTIEFSVAGFDYEDQIYAAETFTFVGTARGSGAGDLIAFSGTLTLAGVPAGNYTVFVSNVSQNKIYGGGLSAFTITPTITSAGAVTLTLAGTSALGGTPIVWDAGYTNAAIQSNTKYMY